jgi:hypothetical protein
VIVQGKGGWLGDLASPGVAYVKVMAISKQWSHSTTAISDQAVGLAKLGSSNGPSRFFLQELRFYSLLGAATLVSVDPSGAVPGFDTGGRVWWRIFGGIVLGHDRVFVISYMLLSVRTNDLIVILLFL